MSDIVFQVIDTACEAADRSFFPPRISLTTKSTTQIATLLGFSEYSQFASVPPKKYRRITWSGSSEQTLTKPSNGLTYMLTNFLPFNPFPCPDCYFFFQDGGCYGNAGSQICPGAGTAWHISFVGSAGYTNPIGGPSGTYTKDFGPSDYPPAVVVHGPFPPLPDQQIAGSRFDYNGASEIDLQGNYVQFYSKNLSEMCSQADKLCMGIAGNGVTAAYNILGWIGATGNNLCPLPGLPYTFQSDQSAKTGQDAPYDSTPLSSGITLPFGANFVTFVKTFRQLSATSASDISSGSQNGITVLAIPQQCGTDAPVNSFEFAANLAWNHNYSAVLDEEYTDAEALAIAQVIFGKGATAQNLSRTTGFVSTFTNVIFTLFASNLIDGTAYTISVDFWDIATGKTTKQYGIIGDKTGNSTITDIIPSPLPGHSITVMNPRITFV